MRRSQGIVAESSKLILQTKNDDGIEIGWKKFNDDEDFYLIFLIMQ